MILDTGYLIDVNQELQTTPLRMEYKKMEDIENNRFCFKEINKYERETFERYN